MGAIHPRIDDSLRAWIAKQLASEEGVGIEPVAKAIREVGPGHCIITSDLGQVGNAVHTDGLLLFVQQLRDRGFTVQETDQMTKQNPAKFLGLE